MVKKAYQIGQVIQLVILTIVMIFSGDSNALYYFLQQGPCLIYLFLLFKIKDENYKYLNFLTILEFFGNLAKVQTNVIIYEEQLELMTALTAVGSVLLVVSQQSYTVSIGFQILYYVSNFSLYISLNIAFTMLTFQISAFILIIPCIFIQKNYFVLESLRQSIEAKNSILS